VIEAIVEASAAADAYYFSTSVLETSTAATSLSSLSTAPEKDTVYTFILTVKLAIEL